MIFLPVPIVIDDMSETGSSGIDLFMGLAVALYDLVASTGLDLSILSSGG